MSTTSQPDNNVVEHTHGLSQGRNYTHTHAFGDYPHGHMLRAICNRPECDGCDTHNIHPSPKERSR